MKTHLKHHSPVAYIQSEENQLALLSHRLVAGSWKAVSIVQRSCWQKVDSSVLVKNVMGELAITKGSSHQDL